jgi:hypothetical protein
MAGRKTTRAAQAGVAGPPIMSGSDIAKLAKDEMSKLTGLQPDSVCGLRHDSDGWHVTLDMVELERIPQSNDLLDEYEAVLDDQGNVVNYQRTRRFSRGESLETKAAEA